MTWQIQTRFSSSSTVNCTTATSTRDFNPILTIASTHTRTAANSSTTSLVRPLPPAQNHPLTLTLDSDGPVELQLPEQWLWDIIDEFIYQFQSFCVWRSKVKSKTDEELMLLVDGNQV